MLQEIEYIPRTRINNFGNERESQDKIEMKETKVSTGKQGTGTRNSLPAVLGQIIGLQILDLHGNNLLEFYWLAIKKR